MGELLEKNQIMSIVPQDFKNSNKGKVIEIQDRKFLFEVLHEPTGISQNNVLEFYSQTKNGMLYFSSNILELNGNILTIAVPKKHRFLQRRAFTRISYMKDIECKLDGKSYKVKSVDISAGGMKLRTKEYLDINAEYDVNIKLLGDENIQSKFQLIRIEKNDDGFYTLSGRFINLPNTAKMKMVQFCMRRNLENINK